jgi:hypothetical protein
MYTVVLTSRSSRSLVFAHTVNSSRVLPAILKKLDINDFELDSSDLYLDTRARHGALFNADEQSDEEE